MRRPARWRGAWLAVALLGAACGREAVDGAERARAAAEETPREGGTAVVVGREIPSTLNPLATDDYVASQLEKHLLFTTLVRLDSASRVRPYLAESWELSEDGTRILFRLRDDVRWHDGTPTTAADVAFTFRAAKDPEVAFPNRAWFDLWEAVEVLDPHTARFTVRPHAEPLYGWSQLPILPRHLLEGVAPADLATHAFGTERPIGNGPFRFVERVGTERWVFEANESFPEGLGGRPRLDRLVYRAVPDAGTSIAELGTGAVHLHLDLPPDRVDRVREAPGLRVLTHPSRTFLFMAWNGQRPPFADASVRRALTHALDRATILRAAREGLGTVATGPVAPGHWAYDSAWTPLAYAPDSARRLLEAAGWRDADADGVREKDGRPLEFELVTNPNRVREDIAVIVQSQLAAVGAAVEVRVREPSALGAAITSPERRYDAALLGFDQDPVLDERAMWSCDRVGQPFQFTSYCNPALDPVLDSIPLTVDREVRRRLIRRFHEMLAADQPVTWLFFEEVATGARTELAGVRPDARGEFATVTRWWLRPGGAAGR